MAPLFCNTTATAPLTTASARGTHIPMCESAARCAVLQDFIMAEPAACGTWLILFCFMGYRIHKRRSLLVAQVQNAQENIMNTIEAFYSIPLIGIVGAGYYLTLHNWMRVTWLSCMYLILYGFMDWHPTVHHQWHTVSRHLRYSFHLVSLLAFLDIGTAIFDSSHGNNWVGFEPHTSRPFYALSFLFMLITLTHLKNQWTRRQCVVVGWCWSMFILHGLDHSCSFSLFSRSHQITWFLCLVEYYLHYTMEQYMAHHDPVHPVPNNDEPTCDWFPPENRMDDIEPAEARRQLVRFENQGGMRICGYLHMGSYILCLWSLYNGTPSLSESQMWPIVVQGMLAIFIMDAIQPYTLLVGWWIPHWPEWSFIPFLTVALLIIKIATDPKDWKYKIGFFFLPSPR